jgi:hypothetical protein
MHMKPILILLLSFGVAMSLSATATAADVGAGQSLTGGTTYSSYDTSGGTGWSVNDPGTGGRQTVYLDPTKGPWVKNLNTGNLQLNIYPLVENLVVGGGPNGLAPAWTDYHEHILTAGWVWYNNADGLHPWIAQPWGGATLTPGANPINADWTFNPALPIGTNVTLTKYVQYIPGVAPQGMVVQISEYPTPEPGTLALLAAGAVGLLAYAWRRKRT